MSVPPTSKREILSAKLKRDVMLNRIENNIDSQVYICIYLCMYS